MMIGKGRRLLAAIGLTSAMLLGGCAYDDGYGYGGVNVGSGYYGGGGYYDGYGGGYYQPGAYGGWYNDFYYPGTGYYVYDRGGRRHRWNDGQRSYWEGRRAEGRGRDNAGRGDGRREGWWNGRQNGNRRYDGRRDGNPATTTPPVPGQQWQGRPRPDGANNGGQQGWRRDRRSGQAVGQPGAQRPQQPAAQRDTPRQRNNGWRGRNGTPRNQPN
jgi:hypothetical protein